MDIPEVDNTASSVPNYSELDNNAILSFDDTDTCLVHSVNGSLLDTTEVSDLLRTSNTVRLQLEAEPDTNARTNPFGTAAIGETVAVVDERDVGAAEPFSYQYPSPAGYDYYDQDQFNDGASAPGTTATTTAKRR